MGGRLMEEQMDFDAIVVGSGMSGGWAAKELCEAGLKTLVIERGKHVEHQADYTDSQAPWEMDNYGLMSERAWDENYPIQSKCYAFNSGNKDWWVNDIDHPYTFPEDRPFYWLRGYHLGGRSLLWARQSYRMSEMDFESNKKDGHGVDWPIRYADMAPWYDKVEDFAGISGNSDKLPQLPDNDRYLPPMTMTPVEEEFGAKIRAAWPTRQFIIGRCAHLTAPKPHHEELGRMACQYREMCYRGCSYGAYFSSLSATLPAAKNTGNLTIVTDAIAHSIEHDPVTGKATGVRVINYHTKEAKVFRGKVIFLCASTIGTAALMLNSRSEKFPTGIANSSDMVGRNLMDHLSGMGASGMYPGFEQYYHHGRRPNGFYIPRYRNVTEEASFVRGYGFQGRGLRSSWQRGTWMPGVGEAFKAELRKPGPWTLSLSGFGEMLPDPNNRVTLSSTATDKWGIPVPHIDVTLGKNDLAMIDQVNKDAVEMLEKAGATNIQSRPHYGGSGLGIHEMGTAQMGHDPRTSVLNKYNQAHDVPNLFVTDGSCMSSGGCQNPSLTYMAMSARGAHHAVEFLKAGKI
jgi:choline dehydrogenase-like flavoprotein